MDTIKFITNCNGCNQCHHREALKCSRDKPLNCKEEGCGDQPQSHKAALPTNATRASWECCESFASITMILIPQQQLLSQERQPLQPKRNERKTETLNAGNLRQIGQIHAPDLPQWTWDQQKNIQKRTCKQNKKHEAVVTRTPRVTRDDCWSSCLAEPVTPSLVTTEQAQMTTTKTTILVVLNPKIKRMLIVQCSGLATATSSQVQSAKNILDGFSLLGCLDLKLDARILIRRLVTSSSKKSVWFQQLTFRASRNLEKVLVVQDILKLYNTNQD